jgi:hypothetical protein
MIRDGAEVDLPHGLHASAWIMLRIRSDPTNETEIPLRHQLALLDRGRRALHVTARRARRRRSGNRRSHAGHAARSKAQTAARLPASQRVRPPLLVSTNAALPTSSSPIDRCGGSDLVVTKSSSVQPHWSPSPPRTTGADAQRSCRPSVWVLAPIARYRIFHKPRAPRRCAESRRQLLDARRACEQRPRDDSAQHVVGPLADREQRSVPV